MGVFGFSVFLKKIRHLLENIFGFNVFCFFSMASPRVCFGGGGLTAFMGEGGGCSEYFLAVLLKTSLRGCFGFRVF